MIFSRIAPLDEPAHFRGGPFFTTNKIIINHFTIGLLQTFRYIDILIHKHTHSNMRER